MRDARLITRVDRLAQGDVTVVLEPLKFIKVIDRYKYRCGLPVLHQRNTFMAAPGTVDQFGEMTAGLRNRTRERHSSTVQLDADSCRCGAPAAAARRRGPLRGRLPAESVHGFGPARNCSKPTAFEVCHYRLRCRTASALAHMSGELGEQLTAVATRDGEGRARVTLGALALFIALGLAFWGLGERRRASAGLPGIAVTVHGARERERGRQPTFGPPSRDFRP